ncbi:DUF6221 family protein [Streptomyces sp. NPDC052000]|uniref:DUF6221 family protein n=1 Tax=Streptomyces sp. NPDC052000 TaxID=3155676 RepID=UPI00344BF009
MTDTDRMLVWLREAMDAAQRDAEAATPGPWEPKGEDPGDDEVYTVHDGEHGDLVGDVVAYVRGGAGRTLANQYLMANHADPVAVLRRIAADRKFLDDLLAEKHHVCDDNWYTCFAATQERDGGTYADTDGDTRCNCGRDTRVARRVGLIAEGWGWTEDHGA